MKNERKRCKARKVYLSDDDIERLNNRFTLGYPYVRTDYPLYTWKLALKELAKPPSNDEEG